MKGIIHSYESLAAVDGKGLRYCVFMAGCPLRCVCCHNPDTWKKEGTEVEGETLVNKIARYKPYFKNNGGVTFSGGEPLLQAEFIESLIRLLAEKEIGYVIDTSGSAELSQSVKNVLDHAETVILDLKFWDDESYRKYTGAGIDKTLKVLEYLESRGIDTWIRTVIIPQINDSEEYLEKYIRHLKGKKCIQKYELLPFHTMGFFKYESLGMENPLKNTKPQGSVKELQAFADSRLFGKD